MAKFCRMSSFAFFIFVLQIWNGYTGKVKIGISHWNDISGQLEHYQEGTDSSSSAPIPCAESQNSTCVGGLANIVHWIHDNGTFTNVASDHIFRLGSGNVIGGESGWLSSINDGWNTIGSIVENHFKPNAMALGMKEFEAGLQQTMNYLNPGTKIYLPATLVNTCKDNYNDTDSSIEATLCKNLPKFQELTVTDNQGSTQKIGVIGFVTPIVERLSLPGKLQFSKIVESIEEQIKLNSSIKTWIAIGDGNLATAKQILDRVSNVKLVIYGVGFGNSQNMTGNYPMKYKNGYIATAGRYGSSVGKLVLDVDTNTGDISATGKLIVTRNPDTRNNQSRDALITYEALEKVVRDEKIGIVGHTIVNFQGGEPCWRQECNLGNLMTDAMVHCAIQFFSKVFPYPLHSIWHGGAFSGMVPAGSSISKFDIHKLLPYHNSANLVKIKGHGLRKIFEASASGIDPKRAKNNDWGQFLQVSNGMEIYYSNKGSAPKLTQVRLVHDYEGGPRTSEISDSRDYYLVIPTFLKEGRSVYNFTVDFWKDPEFENKSRIAFDDDCLENYIRALNPVRTGLEERIWIDAEPTGSCPISDSNPACKECEGSNKSVTVILTIVFCTMFLAVVYVGYFYVIPRLMQTSRVEYHPNQL